MITIASDLPLVGRDAELEQIAAARREGLPGIVISAAAGAGKSRLGRDAIGVAEAGGALTDWVQATASGATIPLGAFARLLDDASDEGGALERMRASARALSARSDGRPIVLAVDDAHLLDPTSAAFVLHLVLTTGVFVIATVRTREPCPDAIVSLWKDVGAARLALEPLDDEAVRTLVETLLDGPLDQQAGHWVLDRSRGNPLHASELVRGAVREGRLALVRDRWRLNGPPRVSDTLVEMLARRLGALAPEEHELLELLALSEPLRVRELVALASFDAINEIERQGLIQLDGGTAAAEVRLAHPLYGDVLRARLPVLRAGQLRLRLASVLQQRDPLEPDDALRIVRLLLDARADVPPELLVDAARAANFAGDPDLGAELATLAGSGAAALLALAQAHAQRERHEQAEAALAPLEAQMPGHELALDYVIQRMRVLFWGLGETAQAHALLARAQAWSTDPVWRRRVLSQQLPPTGDDLAEGISTTERLLADPELAPADRRRLEPHYAMVLMCAGRWTEGEAVARRLRPAIPTRDYHGQLALVAYRFLGVESGATWPDLAAYLNEVLHDGARVNDHESLAQAALGMGHLAFLEGRLLDARRWLTEAEVQFEFGDTFGRMVVALGLQVGVAYALGDHDEVDANLSRLRERSAAIRVQTLSRVAVLPQAEGWKACSDHPVAGAAALLASAQSLAPIVPGFAAVLAYDALLAGSLPGRTAETLEGLATRAQGRLIAAYAAHAAALAAKDGAELLRVSDVFAEIGATRYAKHAAIHAAERFVAEGRNDSARRAAARATALHRPDQGLEPPVIEGVHEREIALTKREAQLVELARHGLTNVEIAERLVLSVRTVESHLYNAMQKLGIDDRRSL